MPAKVTLTVTQGEGEMVGKEFPFEERTTCVIGKLDECNPRIPNNEAHRTISRHHCLLDINPPDVRVRDLGSLNGTFVNGKKIGQRESHQTPEDAPEFPEHDLKDGDDIRLADTVFRVSIHVPTLCVKCSEEISEADRRKVERAPHVFVCDRCHKKLSEVKAEQPEDRAAVPRPHKQVCAKCGKDVSQEIGRYRRGGYICRSCRQDMEGIVRNLLQGALRGRPGLANIRGYTIVRKLGQGGMGAVFLARRSDSAEQVALKVMLPQVAADKRAVDLFLRETEICKALKHPNIVGLRDSGCSDGTFFFTQEFCEGGSLDRHMTSRGGRIPVDEALQITFQALQGLDYAHNAEVPVRLADGSTQTFKGVVHRDLKPPNIFLSGTGKTSIAKVADFGLGKAFDAAGLSGQTRTGSAAGSPCFMPRQQVINFKYSKPEVDIWAMAATLYSMLAGALPRDFARGKDPWRLILTTDPKPIRERNSSIPVRLADVIDTALRDKPEIPFKTVRAFKKALEAAV